MPIMINVEKKQGRKMDWKIKIKYKAKMKCKIKEEPEMAILFHPARARSYSETKVIHASLYPAFLTSSSKLSAAFR